MYWCYWGGLDGFPWGSQMDARHRSSKLFLARLLVNASLPQTRPAAKPTSVAKASYDKPTSSGTHRIDSSIVKRAGGPPGDGEGFDGPQYLYLEGYQIKG